VLRGCYALIQNPDTAWDTIATRIDRYPTTIAREIRRNGGRTHYRAGLADRRALRSPHRPRPRRLQAHGPLRSRITNELATGRSPVAIWADLTAEGTKQVPCVETIYTTVYSGALDVKAFDCLRMRRPRRRNR
jgi:IS30 family transposase